MSRDSARSQPRRYALSWSGGKDSTLALDRARRQGLDVAYLFNIYEGSSGRVRFHGVRQELIAAQAAALDIPLLQAHTGPDDYAVVLDRMLETLHERGVDGIMFGNIHLADIRAWYEERTTARGFVHAEPLWGDDPQLLLTEFIERGYAALVVSIDLARAKPEWLGARIDQSLLASLRATPDVDVCGERGEYHSFVYDGALFQRPVAFTTGESVEMEGHRLLDLIPT